MTLVEQLAAFVTRAQYARLSAEAGRALKVRIVDALGCALGALDGAPVVAVRAHVFELGGREACTLVGGGRTAPDRAALFNGALVRYLDFNDSYLAPKETCHPSDNFGAVLAACEYAKRSGRELLVALAVAYQVQCRLSDVAPVRQRGFDHTTQGSFAAAAGVAKGLGLEEGATSHAIAIAGTALNALRVTRTGSLSLWKGLAYPHTAFGATHAAFLAKHGITGPREVFEGNKGFMESIAGPFTIDWSREDLERVRRTALKRFNAEVHSQSAIEALLELRQEHDLRAEEIERVELSVFQVAFDIIGGGEEGQKIVVRSKEEADHSLPYLAAVALLDGQLMPAQYQPARIVREDVQKLLRRVEVTPDAGLSGRFPELMPCRVRLVLRDGRVLGKAKDDYEGFPTRPMRWERVVEKFHRLAEPFAPRVARERLVELVDHLEHREVSELCALLGGLQKGT